MLLHLLFCCHHCKATIYFQVIMRTRRWDARAITSVCWTRWPEPSTRRRSSAQTELSFSSKYSTVIGGKHFGSYLLYSLSHPTIIYVTLKVVFVNC